MGNGVCFNFIISVNVSVRGASCLTIGVGVSNKLIFMVSRLVLWFFKGVVRAFYELAGQL